MNKLEMWREKANLNSLEPAVNNVGFRGAGETYHATASASISTSISGSTRPATPIRLVAG
jgi:hypothetical protein